MGGAGQSVHERSGCVATDPLPEPHVGLLVALEQSPPQLPRSCSCSRCNRRLGRDEVAVLALVGVEFEVFCYGHCPVPVDSRHLAWNRCWCCLRAMLLDVAWHWAPFCSRAHRLSGEAALVGRREVMWPAAPRISRAA